MLKGLRVRLIFSQSDPRRRSYALFEIFGDVERVNATAAGAIPGPGEGERRGRARANVWVSCWPARVRLWLLRLLSLHLRALRLLRAQLVCEWNFHRRWTLVPRLLAGPWMGAWLLWTSWLASRVLRARPGISWARLRGKWSSPRLLRRWGLPRRWRFSRWRAAVGVRDSKQLESKERPAAKSCRPISLSGRGESLYRRPHSC